jgi:serine phosphatase RsbU (regulator of sigma subunit)
VVSASDIASARILVVDDLDANVLLLEGMLRVAGYTSVDSTTDPTQVCKLHQKNQYSLILLDLQMPVMDGFQVMQELQNIEADGYLPVLVITAQPDQKLRALQAGAKDFVGKPFDMAELRARVRNILEVRLLHLKATNYSLVLEQTVRELETSREEIRVKNLAERERSEKELTLAQQTQESLLPRSLPEFENYRIHAFNSPTRYVGGDFYDFLQLSSGEWMGVLADVSGKGIPAALLSSMLLGALSVEFHSGTDAALTLERVNRLLCEKSLPQQFVTLFLFLLRADGTGCYFSAGHNPAYLFRAATGTIEEIESTGFFLGMFDTAEYSPRMLRLNQGDILIVNSDGLTDAQNPLGQMFGEKRLLEIIRSEAKNGSQTVECKILQAIEEFTEALPQTDDVTFLLVEKYR